MKENFIDAKGKPQIKFIVESIINSVELDHKTLTKIITRCANQSKSENQCESAFNLLYCYTNDEKIKKIMQRTKTEL